jgi:hypothetical protein
MSLPSISSSHMAFVKTRAWGVAAPRHGQYTRMVFSGMESPRGRDSR